MSIDPPAPSSRGWRLALIACCAILILFGALSYSAALTKSATYDEPRHVVGGWLQTHYSDLRMDYETLPLGAYWASLPNDKSAIQFNWNDPAWLRMADDLYAEFELAPRTLFQTPGNDGMAIINRSRFMMMLLGVGLGALIATWSWQLGGGLAAIVATFLFCLDPNMLGHASMVKTDLPAALTIGAAVLSAWHVGRALTWWNAMLLGLFVAIAMNTKFTAIALGPILFMLLFLRVALPASWQVLRWNLVRRSHRAIAAAMLLVACAIVTYAAIWACHRFRFNPSPDPSVSLSTDAYRSELILAQFRATHPRPSPPQFDSTLSAPAMTETTASRLQTLDQSLHRTGAAIEQSPLPTTTKDHLQQSVQRAATVRDETDKLLDRLQPPAPTTQPALMDDVRSAMAAIADSQDQLDFAWYYATLRPEQMPLSIKIATFILDHRLLPAPWIDGLMVQYSRTTVLDAYFLGEIRHHGTWYYFPVAIISKTPVASLAALAIALGAAIGSARARSREWRNWIWPAACVVIPAAFIMASAMSANLNTGLRHAFPFYPFMFVGAGVSLAALLRKWNHSATVTATALGALLLLETVAAWPNYLAFFNTVTRYYPGAYYLLSDSNLDWGQDLPLLAKWQQAHPRVPLALAYFGQVDPAFYKISSEPLPPWPPPQQLALTHVLAVSATYLQGSLDARYTGYGQLPPSEILGGTIYLYDLRPGR